MMMDEVEYRRVFGIDPPNKSILNGALDNALDIRKFEIELYWKRASYFWTLIAAAFAGFFVILGATNIPEKKFLAFTVACVGFFFTFAWFQVNKGSKKWQENWENHVDLLEDAAIGPLYKTVLSRKDGDGLFETLVTGPSNISVSKINQIVNLFTLVIWVILAYSSLDTVGIDYPLSIKHVVVSAITVMFCILILVGGKTHPGSHTPVASLRSTTIHDG
jgi:hypothetical protein